MDNIDIAIIGNINNLDIVDVECDDIVLLYCCNADVLIVSQNLFHSVIVNIAPSLLLLLLLLNVGI
jgi:hypothetical protein